MKTGIPCCPRAARGIVALAIASAMLATDAAAQQYWRGTDDNPVWDATTANWAANATTTERTTYQNNTSSSQPTFDAGGASDVTVAEGGVKAYVLNVRGGDHTLSGGPVVTQVIDPLGGDLTILNTVDCSPDATQNYLGFRPRSGASTITIGNGGVLNAQIAPWNDSTLATRLVVAEGGTLNANFNEAGIKNNRFTLYFDGGKLVHKTERDRTFTSSDLVVGTGGMHVGEAEAVSSQSIVPGPIKTDASLATDGGVWIDEHSGYTLLPDNDCTYRGGLHIDSSDPAADTSAGGVAIRRDRSLGAVPAEPQDNVFFEKSGACLVAHGTSGSLLVNKNRNFRIADGVTAKLQSWSGKPFSMVVQGTIDCDDRENAIVEVYSHWGINDNGVVALCPADGRTNHIGRLRVRAPAVIGSGTTILENTTSLGSDSDLAEKYGYDGGAPLYVMASSGHLMVTGGVLKVAASGRYVTQNNRLTVSGGVADFSECAEVLHADLAGSSATTTVKDGGVLAVKALRLSGPGAGGNAARSVLNLQSGGVLRVSEKVYVHQNQTGYKATVNCDGGVLHWVNKAFPYAPYVTIGGGSGTVAGNSMSGIAWNALAGGLVVSNDVSCYFVPPLASGAEKDGGVTKWGTGTFALFNTANSFNGPVTIMQGEFRLGASGVIPETGTARVAAGTKFISNTYSQTLARIEGSGTFGEVSRNDQTLLSVTSAIAPGMGADAPGTLTVSGGALDIADGTALEIDVGANGACDRLSYSAGLDLSALRLVVNDVSKLDKNFRYEIVSAPQGCIGEFASTNLPGTWHVKYGATKAELVYTTPFVMVVR